MRSINFDFGGKTHCFEQINPGDLAKLITHGLFSVSPVPVCQDSSVSAELLRRIKPMFIPGTLAFFNTSSGVAGFIGKDYNEDFSGMYWDKSRIYSPKEADPLGSWNSGSWNSRSWDSFTAALEKELSESLKAASTCPKEDGVTLSHPDYGTIHVHSFPEFDQAKSTKWTDSLKNVKIIARSTDTGSGSIKAHFSGTHGALVSLFQEFGPQGLSFPELEKFISNVRYSFFLNTRPYREEPERGGTTVPPGQLLVTPKGSPPSIDTDRVMAPRELKQMSVRILRAKNTEGSEGYFGKNFSTFWVDTAPFHFDHMPLNHQVVLKKSLQILKVVHIQMDPETKLITGLELRLKSRNPADYVTADCLLPGQEINL